VVGFEGTARATLFPSGTEHEMLNDQLAPSFKKIRQRFLAVCAFEDVFLLDFDPGQFAALPVDFIALASQLLLLDEQLLASHLPFRCGYHFWTFYGARFHDEISPLIRVFASSLGW
jgi:hypothetical protein